MIRHLQALLCLFYYNSFYKVSNYIWIINNIKKNFDKLTNTKVILINVSLCFLDNEKWTSQNKAELYNDV